MPQEPEEMCPEIDCIQDNMAEAIRAQSSYEAAVLISIADDQLEHLRSEIAKLRTWGHYWRDKCSK